MVEVMCSKMYLYQVAYIQPPQLRPITGQSASRDLDFSIQPNLCEKHQKEMQFHTSMFEEATENKLLSSCGPSGCR